MKTSLQALEKIQSLAETGTLTLGDVLVAPGKTNAAFFVLFLSLPFCQPVPLLGLSTPVGFAIATLGACLLLGRPATLPLKLARLHLPNYAVVKTCSLVRRLFSKTQTWIRPRYTRFVTGPFANRASGLLIVVHASLLSLPLPVPFSNFFPAIVLMLLALGKYEEDGLVVIVGLVATVFNAAFFIFVFMVPFLSWQFIDRLLA